MDAKLIKPIRNRVKRVAMVPASELRPSPHNWKEHGSDQMEALRGVLEEIGFCGFEMARELPDGSLELVDGHARAEICGDQMVPVAIVDLSESEARKVLATFDPIAAMAATIPEKLDALLRDVQTGNQALAEMLEEMANEAGLLEMPEPEFTPEEIEPPQPPEDPKTRVGDCYLLGKHRLVCGDATSPATIAKATGGQAWQSVVTDPPYGMAFRSNRRSETRQAIANDDDESMLYWAIALPASHSKYIFCRWNNIPKTPRPRSVIVWKKPNHTMGNLQHEHGRQYEVCLFYAGANHNWPGKRPSDFIEHAITGNDMHATQKPVALMADVIQWTDGIIFEPFAGSGTTLIAAEQLGRVCFACEIDPANCDVIIQRWETLTGQTARLE